MDDAACPMLGPVTPSRRGGALTEDLLEGEFAAAMQDIYRQAKVEAGYNPTAFLRMLQERGAMAAAHYLIHTAKPSDGFTALWAKGRLDLTVEAHVLEPRSSSRCSPTRSVPSARTACAAPGNRPA